MMRQVGFSTREPYASYFGIFEVHGVKVEVMGDLVIKYRDGLIDVKDHWSRWSDKVRVLHFENSHVPVIPAGVATRRQHPAGASGTHRRHRPTLLDEHGFDRPYLEALLQDRQLGQRTLARCGGDAP